MRRIRSHLTYANVMVTILAFVVLGGGTALASYVISSNSQVGPNAISGHTPPSGDHANVIPGSVNGQDVADNSLRGADINESTLGKVPSAASADSVNGKSAAQLEGARAYATVFGAHSRCGDPVGSCSIRDRKGVAYAVHVATGDYCVGVDGISGGDHASLAVVTPAVRRNAWAIWLNTGFANVNCVDSEFEVVTGEGANPADEDFTIVIP